MVTVSATVGSLTAYFFKIIHYVCTRICISWEHKEHIFKYFLLFEYLIKQMIWLSDKSIFFSHTLYLAANLQFSSRHKLKVKRFLAN